ncbi:MAG: hypothetical protein L3J91_01240 [Thermoplasmata archaeon]|nr:hypothetical protein [Thermoplasmata archaeon]
MARPKARPTGSRSFGSSAPPWSEGSAASLANDAHELLPASRLVIVGGLDPHGGPGPQGEGITYLRKPFRIAEFASAVGRSPEAKAPGPA